MNYGGNNNILMHTIIMIVQGLAMGYIASVKTIKYDKVYLIITILFIILFFGIIFRNYFTIFNIITEILINNLEFSQDCMCMWLGLYIFNLMRYLKKVVKK